MFSDTATVTGRAGAQHHEKMGNADLILANTTIRAGILAGMVPGVYATVEILKHRGEETVPGTALRVLPCFHGAMVLYAAGIALGAFLALAAPV